MLQKKLIIRHLEKPAESSLTASWSHDYFVPCEGGISSILYYLLTEISAMACRRDPTLLDTVKDKSVGLRSLVLFGMLWGCNSDAGRQLRDV